MDENVLGVETITVVRAPMATDTRDNSLYQDWDNATSTDITGCMVQPFKMSNKLVHEDEAGRLFMQEFFRIWMPAGTDVLYTDRLVWRTVPMDVWGEPGRWHDFDGVEDHIQLLGIVRRG